MDLLVYITLGLVLLYFLLKRRARKGKPIPGPTGWPVVGNALDVNIERLHEEFADLAEQHGEIFQITIFGQTFVVLNTAKIVRMASCTSPYARLMSDRPKTFMANAALFGCRALAFMPKAYGSPHGELRKLYTKGLHCYGDGRKEFETLVTSELEKLMERIEAFKGEEFDMVKLLKHSFSNLLSILLTGQEIMDDDTEDKDMFWDINDCMDFFLMPVNDSIMGMFPFLRFIPGLYKRKYDKLMKARNRCLSKVFYDTKVDVCSVVQNDKQYGPWSKGSSDQYQNCNAFIHGRIKATYKEGRVRGLVDFFLEQQYQARQAGTYTVLTDEAIMATILETVPGGLLTTTTSLSATILCLLNYPQYQAKVKEELDTVIGTDRLSQLSDRKQCVFTEAVSLEVQRYSTVFVYSGFRFCEPNIEFMGYDIPAKSVVIPNNFYIHHDSKVWGDPWTFRPERWLEETGELLPVDHNLRKNWLAFGSGRRQCIGESLARNRLFLYMSTLLKRWNFVTSPEHAVSCDQRDGQYDVNLISRPRSFMCRAVPWTKNATN